MQPQQPGAQTYGTQQPPTAAMVPTGSVAHEITHGPSFSMLRVDIAPGQTVVSEAGAMVARHQSVSMEAKLNAPGGGLFASIKALIVAFIRKVVGGETFIVNHFSSTTGGSVWLAPTMSGQVLHRRLNGEKLVLSTGAYLAHVGDVRMGLQYGGIRALLAKEGAFFLAMTGHGDLWFSSYGGIEVVDVNGPFTVDNGHLVGYEGNLTFGIGSAGGGMMGLMASGEGLVCKFNGQGRVYIQSRNTSALVSWIAGL